MIALNLQDPLQKLGSILRTALLLHAEEGILRRKPHYLLHYALGLICSFVCSFVWL